MLRWLLSEVNTRIPNITAREDTLQVANVIDGTISLPATENHEKR